MRCYNLKGNMHACETFYLKGEGEAAESIRGHSLCQELNTVTNLENVGSPIDDDCHCVCVSLEDSLNP